MQIKSQLMRQKGYAMHVV